MWYRYKDYNINLNNILMFQKPLTDISPHRILFLGYHFENILIEYLSKDERDTEFEKICKMLGLEEKEHISRCC